MWFVSGWGSAGGRVWDGPRGSGPASVPLQWGGMEEANLNDRLRQIDEDVERARSDARAALGVQRQLTNLTVKATSPRREVMVEIDVAGRLLGITFMPASTGLSPQRLSRVTMETVSAAKDRVAVQVQAVVSEQLVDNPALATRMLKAFKQVAGEEPPSITFDDDRDEHGGRQEAGPGGGSGGRPGGRPGGRRAGGLFFPGQPDG